MTRFFKMESDNYLDFGVTKSPILAGQSVFRGEILDRQRLPALVFEIDFPDDVELPHFLTGGTVLASKTLLDTLKACGVNNFQAFPAELVNPETGSRRLQHYLFNVLGLVQAADRESSDYDVLMAGKADEAPLLAFNEIVVDADKAKDFLMFRLAEDPTALIVHESIVNALADNRPSGGWGIDVIELR